jgi:GAF domain-containing protein
MGEREQTAGVGVLGVLDVAREVLSDLDLDVVLERVVEAARQLAGARYAALGVLDRSKDELERFIRVDIDDAQRAELSAPSKRLTPPSRSPKRSAARRSSMWSWNWYPSGAGRWCPRGLDD